MAKSRKKRKVRESQEFSVAALRQQMRAPMISSAAYSWTLEQIMDARDEQMAGRFARPAKLAASMRTLAALAVAYKNRLAPQRALGVRLKPAKGARAATIAGEAEPLFGQGGVAVTTDTLATINGDLANHGLGIGCNGWQPRDDGSRVDVTHHAWPIEHVWWDSVARCLMTQIETETAPSASYAGGFMRRGALEPIIHGDGRWVVYSSHELTPWRQDAAILPGSLVWASGAFADRDWGKGSASHGNAKVTGQLPEGVNLQDKNADGVMELTREAAEFLESLLAVASLDVPVAIHPFGSKMDYTVNQSRAWEVWEKLALKAERAAARIYLGTDGTLGAQGGAPGVDIAVLFGIATTIMQGDLSVLSTGIRTGVLEPWAAVNFGDSSLTPTREYIVHDVDTMQARANIAANEAAFCKAIQERRGAGFEVTQQWVDELADRFGVDRLQLAATQTSGLILTPSTIEKIARVDEGRAAVGLPPDGSTEGQKWIAEVGPATDVPAVSQTALRIV